jgi:hypothetical protein
LFCACSEPDSGAQPNGTYCTGQNYASKGFEEDAPDFLCELFEASSKELPWTHDVHRAIDRHEDEVHIGAPGHTDDLLQHASGAMLG